MAVFIVTNRSVNSEGKVEVSGEESARPDFRIATYSPVDSDDEVGTYNVLSDFWGFDFEPATALSDEANGEDLENLKGSQFMFRKLYDLMSSPNGGDVLVMIHGFNYNFNSNLTHINRLCRLYAPSNLPGAPSSNSNIQHLIYISWPTMGRFAYDSDQYDAKETGKVLGRLLIKLSRFFKQMFEEQGLQPCCNKIHLAVHSMGNQVLYHMLNDLREKEPWPVFSEALLLNADVRWDCFESDKAMSKLSDFCERIHIYIHRHDDALRISRFTKNWKRRLGFKGPSKDESLPAEAFIVDTTHVASAENDARLEEGLRGDDSFTATGLKERMFDHWGYLCRQGVIEDVRAVLSGEEEDRIFMRSRQGASQRFLLNNPAT